MHFFEALVVVTIDLITIGVALVGAGGRGFAGSTDLTAMGHSGGVTTRLRIAGLVAVIFSALLATGGQALAASPSVTSISPNTGNISGQAIPNFTVITGTGFTGATSAAIGGSTAPILSVDSDTQITVRAPAGIAGVTDVVVFTPSGNSGSSGQNLYTYFSGSPSISVVGPNFGLTTGGNTIFISGNNFVPGPGATTVSIGGHPATGVTVSSAGSLTAIVPAGTAGVANITVTTPGGSGGVDNLYTYFAPTLPTVTSVTPNGGSIANGGTVNGGVAISIKGVGFIGASSVTIGGNPVAAFVVKSNGEITTTTLAHAAGPVDIAVTVPGGGTGILTGGFTYVLPPPVVTTITPPTGSTAGGTSVTISGQNFTGANSVTIGGVPVTSFSVNAGGTSITATTAAHAAGTADVIVTTPVPAPGGSSGTGANLYTYGIPAPVVASISPTSGVVGGGTSVTITGTGFTGATAVKIGGTAATGVIVVNDTTITATTPAHAAGVVNVAVTTPPGTGTGSLFTYTASAPTVTSVSANSGPTQGGTLITITGTNFSGAPQVTVGGVQAKDVAIISSTVIQAVTPAGTGTKDVVVITSFGSSPITAADQFTYTTPVPVAPSAPMVTAVSPASGSTLGGTSVTITGSNFTGATLVTIGGAAATGVTVVDSNTITATTPAGTLGARDVAVTTPGGTGTGTGLYTYVTLAPTVTAIVANSGTNLGGTPVTITGTNFTGATSVMIGGNAATNVTVSSATTITATTPAGTGSNVPVVVTTPGGTSPAANLYSYVAASPPTVTAVSPNHGSAAGGTSITITGTNFTGATAVTIGGSAAQFVNVVSATSITAVIPMHAAGVVDVTVTTPAGTSATNAADQFTYVAAPAVTSVSPASGPPAGGTTVTITGTGFTGATSVTIGGSPATGITVNGSGTTITAITPAHVAGIVDVVVTSPTGNTGSSGAGLFTYVTPTPTVTAIALPSGSTTGGTSVTITGTNFTGATSVTIGGNAATNVTVTSATTITATTPAGTGSNVPVVVTTPGGPSAPANIYTYVTPPPTVTAIVANSGTNLGGTPVTITGTNFTGATSVMIGGNAATNVTVSSATTITATTPAGTGSNVPVVVTTPGGTSPAANLYSYVAVPPPTVTAVSPNHGNAAGGTSITVTGTNFTGATSVTIGGSAAQFVNVVSATSITAITPAHAAGVVDVTVTTPAGTSATNAADQFTYVAVPAVTGVSPATGPLAGGTTVTITGTGFTGATAVTIGGSPATGITVNGSGTSITAITPAHVAGVVDVTVTTPGDTSPTNSTARFSYGQASSSLPAVTALSSSSGSPAGGTTVTITGTGLTGVTTVMFGGTAATGVAVNGSGTSITVTSPPGTGTVDVTVTTLNGTSTPTSAGRFSYVKATTSLTLTSSPNPSVVGQAVTFTARITGNSPTGLVTFSLPNRVIGTATLLGGVATLVIASLPAGSNPVTASYPGDANNASDPEMVVQIVNAVSTDSANLRRMQLSAMPIVANLSGQAISGAIDNAIGVGLSGYVPAPTPNGSGFTYYFAEEDPQVQPGPSSNPGRAVVDPTLPNGQARLDDAFTALDYAAGPPAKPPPAAAAAQPRNWLAWIDVRGADFSRTTSGDDLKGTQVNAIGGLTARFTPDFLIGVLGGYEHFNFTSQAYDGLLRGDGWTAGAYLGWRLGANLRFDAAGAWSDIMAAGTAGTASGNFTGHRWFASGGLTGTFGWEPLVFEPSARVYALLERDNAYTDSLGALQAAHSFDTARASAGLKVSYPVAMGSGAIAPYVGLYGDYYFSKDDATTVALTPVLLLQGFGARATGGFTATFGGGAQLSAGGEFSGIGSNTHIWTLRLRGGVPF